MRGGCRIYKFGVSIMEETKTKIQKCETDKLKKRIDLLYREIFFAKSQYLLFDRMCMDFSKMPKYKEYYCSVIDGLQYSLFMKLAKIYDNDFNNDSITVFYMLNCVQCNKLLNKKNSEIIKYAKSELEKLENMKALDKLKTLRDKNVAHLDKSYDLGIKSFKADEIPAYNEIPILLDYAHNIIIEIYKLVFGEQIEDSKKFEMVELQYNSIIQMQNSYPDILVQLLEQKNRGKN